MLSDWRIVPFVGIGQLAFGMHRGAVRQMLAEEPRLIVKTLGRPPVEQYRTSGLQAHYDEHNRLELVEFFSHASVTFRGIELLAGRELVDVDRDLRALGVSGVNDGLGDVRFDCLGFELYVEGDNIGSVGVFGREYDDHP